MLDQLFDLTGLDRSYQLPAASDHPWEWLQRLDAFLRRFESRRPSACIEACTHLDETLGPIHVQDGAIIQFGTVIRGPAFIGAASNIGPNALVSSSLVLSGSVIGHCSQVVRSIFLPGAKAPHLNYVGDSVLGRGVNFGAGAKTGNLPLDPAPHQGVRIVWDGVVVDTGMRKFGALVGDGTRLGCNCVLNPGTIVGKNGRVYGQATIGGTFGPSRRIRPAATLKDTAQTVRG